MMMAPVADFEFNLMSYGDIGASTCKERDTSEDEDQKKTLHDEEI
jgi:hypothetical protein